jgi:NAD(P)-dependent dehydrogenase (short-subunit alcohol dehydrogenase family)
LEAKKSAALVTGISGGLGKGIYQALVDAGFFVIGVDRAKSDIEPNERYHEIPFDVDVLIDSAAEREDFKNAVLRVLGANNMVLKGLVNNAAIQLLGTVDDLRMEDFRQSLKTNLEVPLQLVLLFKDQLASNKGSVVNIDSIHSRLTKPAFISYATSKSGISGLTRALAIDFQGRVRVNGIQPAAIETPMLMAGFEGKSEEFKMLQSFHPLGRIGEPREVGELVAFLMSDRCDFINGACLTVDGGIGVRLHDPI